MASGHSAGTSAMDASVPLRPLGVTVVSGYSAGSSVLESSFPLRPVGKKCETTIPFEASVCHHLQPEVPLPWKQEGQARDFLYAPAMHMNLQKAMKSPAKARPNLIELNGARPDPSIDLSREVTTITDSSLIESNGTSEDVRIDFQIGVRNPTEVGRSLMESNGVPVKHMPNTPPETPGETPR